MSFSLSCACGHSPLLRLVLFLMLKKEEAVCVSGETEETCADMSVPSSSYSEGVWKMLRLGWMFVTRMNLAFSSFLYKPH